MKRVVIIAGPTAVGKTSLAISLAQALNTEIISCDSRQCYKELKIGVARPSPEELAAVPHHFIASHSVHEKVTAITFEQYALKKAAELFTTHDTVVMVGGTGLYIRAFTDGLDEIPTVPAEQHEALINEYKEKGIEWLQEVVAAEDPQFYGAGEIHNPQRLMRALEVLRFTGQSILSFRKGEKAARDFEIFKIALDLPKEQLHHNINHRVMQMMKDGLLEEVKSLQPWQELNALQTVGYREIFNHLNGLSSLDAAIEKIGINTRQYAKRQLTWFRKDSDYHWVTPDPGAVMNLLQQA
jgi:tRNA dimethylallyltransferase